MLLDTFHSRFIVKGEIHTIKPLHIGVSDDGTNPVLVDSAVIKDSNNLPLIPASSLKGVLRSTLESILSNKSKKNQWCSCNILSDNENDGQVNCNSIIKEIKESKTSSNLSQKELAEKIYENSCFTCKLFGNKYMSGRVIIRDMNCLDEEIITERRDGVGIDRDSNTAYRGAKYGYEIVPSDTRFDFYLTGENLDEKEKKLVEFLIRLLEEGEISIGGKTSSGLGQIELKITNKKEISTIDELMEHYKMEG